MADRQIHILSTAEMDPEIVEYISGKNIIITVDPFICIENQVPVTKKVWISQLAKEKQTVIFTSRHAVKAVISSLKKTPDWIIYCLNGGTYKTVLSFWPEESIAGTAKNGKELGRVIHPETDKGDVIFFCGNQRLDEIPRQMAERGIPLTEITVYRTVLKPHTIDKKYDAIFFYSPSGADSFFKRNKIDMNIPLFSIGETTTAAIRKHIGETYEIITAYNPDKREMAEMAIYYFEQKNR